MEGEGAAREAGGACRCAAVPVQTFGAPGQPEESDTIHQTRIRCFWIQSRRRALTQTGNSAHFWMLALIVRSDIGRHCRQEDSDTVTHCQWHRPASPRIPPTVLELRRSIIHAFPPQLLAN